MGLLRLDHREPLGYGCVRAKKAAAFAGNSFSIRGRRISASLSTTHFTFLDGAYALYVRVWDADTGRRLGGAYDGCEI